MTRPVRIVRNIGIGLVGLILLLGIAAIIIVQTGWFRNYVRETIISATESGTGGRVEVGSFSFNWRALEAVVSEFVIHGKEPSGSAPFVPPVGGRDAIDIVAADAADIDLFCLIQVEGRSGARTEQNLHLLQRRGAINEG